MALFRRNVVPMIIGVPSIPEKERDYHDGQSMCPVPDWETYLRYNKTWTCKRCNIKYRPVPNGWTPANPFIDPACDEDSD